MLYCLGNSSIFSPAVLILNTRHPWLVQSEGLEPADRKGLGDVSRLAAIGISVPFTKTVPLLVFRLLVPLLTLHGLLLQAGKNTRTNTRTRSFLCREPHSLVFLMPSLFPQTSLYIGIKTHAFPIPNHLCPQPPVLPNLLVNYLYLKI